MHPDYDLDLASVVDLNSENVIGEGNSKNFIKTAISRLGTSYYKGKSVKSKSDY